jgi:hypothetical protein
MWIDCWELEKLQFDVVMMRFWRGKRGFMYCLLEEQQQQKHWTNNLDSIISLFVLKQAVKVNLKFYNGHKMLEVP